MIWSQKQRKHKLNREVSNFVKLKNENALRNAMY